MTNNITNRHTVAVHIPVKNCAGILDECLSALSWVDEIIVGDASDNDEIKTLIHNKYPQAKHFFDSTDDIRLRLNNLLHYTDSDFILWVHSDEFYTSESAQEILEALKIPCLFDGFEIPSVSYNYGECLGIGATQLRLFRKDKFSWPMNSIHDMPKVEGSVKTLTQPYSHNNNPVLGMNAVKHFRYEANNAAQISDAELEAVSLNNLQPGALKKQVLINLFWINWRFLRMYWAYRHLGFAGLCMAYNAIFQVIAAQITPTEELRMRKGIITRDRRGYY